MGVTINGYALAGELSAQNAGFCQWGFCQKDGREYFIKEFLSPVYPADNPELSAKIIERKRKACDDFFENKKAFYEVLSRCRSGNNILIEDFFRSGTKYYIVTDKVEADGTDPEMISILQRDKKEAFIRSVLYSISLLHGAGLVHADLKPDNILLKKTSEGYYAAKIIDFDAGFIAGRIPSEIQGDFIYLAPEVYLRINEEDVSIDEKIDIFALGILFHQYWTGKLPKVSGNHRYAFEAVLDEDPIELSDDLPSDLKENISRMLFRNPADRPSARQLLDSYRAKDQLLFDTFKEPDPIPAIPIVPQPASDAPVSRVKKSPGFYVPKDLD